MKTFEEITKQIESDRIRYLNNKFTNFNNFYANVFLETTGVVTIKNCTFEEGLSYHVIEWGTSTVVGNGSSITGCTIGNCCTHNTISLYTHAEGNVYNFAENTFAYSGNAFRFSDANSVAATINLTGNKYLTTDTSAKTDQVVVGDCFAGLWTAEQFAETQDLSKLTVNMSGNVFDPVGTEVYPLNSLGTGKTQAYNIYNDTASWTTTVPVVNFI